MFGSCTEALKFIADKEIAMVDLKVVGVPGQWLHITIPARNFTEKHFAEGVGYDGSSGSGFSEVESGDVAARPEPGAAFVDPFWEHPTISFLCETVTADTKEPLAGDPRSIARRAVEYMRSGGVADQAWMAPEFEFYIFDRVEVSTDPYCTSVGIHSFEVEPDGTSAAIRPRGGICAFRLPSISTICARRSP